jgi:DNA-binding transcriptional MerR regulator
MFSIGEFARHGRVSVRMLRHYDAIGLLRPASVDPDSGYRFYRAGQLAELNRIIYLTDPREEPDMSKWVTQLAFRLAD